MIHQIYTDKTNAIKFPDDLVGRTEEYRQDRMSEWRKACNVVVEEFKLALYKEYNVENHPKRHELFRLCWDASHSGGFSDIEYAFEDFSVLLKTTDCEIKSEEEIRDKINAYGEVAKESFDCEYSEAMASIHMLRWALGEESDATGEEEEK